MKKLLELLTVLALTFGYCTQVRAAELPTIEVGLPEDGMFGLGGQYLIDKGIDKKHGFIVKPRWAAVADVERLMAIGAISVGLATSESAVRANLNQIAIRLIQPYQTPHNSILVRIDSPYKELRI